MNYKRIIKSQSLRMSILKAFKWVPDRIMIPLQYRIKLGRWPNLKEPKRYTEKLQVYKMRYRNPIMGQCVDKYDVRNFVKDKGLERILIPLYGVYSSPDEIDFDALPNSFVLKTTDGGGGKNVLVCDNKDGLDIKKTRALLSSWMNVKDINAGREWAYTQIKDGRIMAEKKLKATNPDMGLMDYKFFCFDGVFKYLYVITERVPGKKAVVSVYTRDFKKLNVARADESSCDYTVPRPSNYEEMIEIAEKLAEGFPHVRVDLYNENGVINFGELTFYDGSGYFSFIPDSFDYEFGAPFNVEGLLKSKNYE